MSIYSLSFADRGPFLVFLSWVGVYFLLLLCSCSASPSSYASEGSSSNFYRSYHHRQSAYLEDHFQLFPFNSVFHWLNIFTTQRHRLLLPCSWFDACVSRRCWSFSWSIHILHPTCWHSREEVWVFKPSLWKVRLKLKLLFASFCPFIDNFLLQVSTTSLWSHFLNTSISQRTFLPNLSSDLDDLFLLWTVRTWLVLWNYLQ